MTSEQKKLARESGKRIKKYAKRKGMTQKELSTNTFFSVSAIRKIYQGDRNLQESQAEIFANILGVRKEYLLCLDNDPTDEDRNKRLFRESVEYAISSSAYMNQFLNDACRIASFNFSGVVIEENSTDFIYRINIPGEHYIDINQEEFEAWFSNCLQYAAFSVNLLVKEKQQMIKEGDE